ncbi:capsid protein [Ferret hepatitis E virus]|uniref:Pro-secreted protein ORF2 n=1 Tax=Ferret hepatitis E virus TaxID=1213422 RepID=I7BBQ9_9VIRU|nr:capsid protein [Ferret hepatitis E virus]
MEHVYKMRFVLLLLLLLFVSVLLAAPMYPSGTGGRPGNRRGTRTDTVGTGTSGLPPPITRADARPNWMSSTNPFAPELSRVPPLGSAWADRPRPKRQPRNSRVPDAGQSPLTAVAPAPNTAPVPDYHSRGAILKRQYNLSTSPLTLTVPQSSNSILFAASLNPLLPLQDGSNTHIMATEASNYAQYRIQAATLRFRPLVPNSVGGYAMSMSFWPQSTTVPTSVDMNSITSTDVRVVSQPGLSAELVIPRERLHYRNQGWRSVETNAVPQEESTSGMIMVCIHGAPINSFTNSPYTGALGLLDLALQLEYRNLTPGNTNTRINRYRTTAQHKIRRLPDGTAQVSSAAAMRFMQDVHLPRNNGLGDVGRGIVQVLLNIADTLLGGLPTDLVSNAGGQMFYGRPQVSANGEPSVKLYTSVEAAQLDHGVVIPHDIDLGLSSVTLQDYDNQHIQDRPTPSPAPVRPITNWRTGDVVWVTLPAAQYIQSSSVLDSHPAYWSAEATIINVATGQRAAVSSIKWDQVTLNGRPLHHEAHSELIYYKLPLMGKISFWEQGTTKAGYTYNYNTVDSDNIWVWWDSGSKAYLYVSTYTTMLGAGPVDITGVGAVGPTSSSAARTVDPSHTLQDGCPACASAGLSSCLVAEAIARVKLLSVSEDV